MLVKRSFFFKFRNFQIWKEIRSTPSRPTSATVVWWSPLFCSKTFPLTVLIIVRPLRGSAKNSESSPTDTGWNISHLEFNILMICLPFVGWHGKIRYFSQYCDWLDWQCLLYEIFRLWAEYWIGEIPPLPNIKWPSKLKSSPQYIMIHCVP